MSEAGSKPIERYFQIIEVVAASQNGLSLNDIVQITGLPKPTAHRLVRSLTDLEILINDNAWYKNFRVGPRMWRILQLGAEPQKLVSFSQIVVDDLAAQLGETTYIVRLEHDQVSAIARAVPDQGHRLHVLPGHQLPSHAAASAKAILAFQDDETVRRHLREPLEKLTPRTLTNVDAVLAEFASIRQQGFAVCDREIDENVMAYACPVTLETVGVLYAVGVTGPVNRLGKMPAEHWIGPMKEAASRFASMLRTMTPS